MTKYDTKSNILSKYDIRFNNVLEHDTQSNNMLEHKTWSNNVSECDSRQLKLQPQWRFYNLANSSNKFNSMQFDYR